MSRRPNTGIRRNKRLFVASIDIGTSYSGYAYSSKDTPKDVKICPPWTSSGTSVISLKTPTCILLNKDREFSAFGYDAEDRYSHLAETDSHQDWLFVRQFKMTLYNDKHLRKDFLMEDVTGKKVEALKVFSLSINYLKEHLLASLEKQYQGVTVEDITFVLTVPAIWNDKAKFFMRVAARRAGIANDQLLIALEPEAASVWCQNIGAGIDGDTDGPGVHIGVPGTQYMVVDLGGGTADITVHEKQPNGRLKEVYKVSGGPWGGAEVNEEFINLLTDIVTEEVFAIFKENQTADLIDILREFETHKRAIHVSTHKRMDKVRFRIPMSLKECFETAGKLVVDIEERFREKVVWKNDKMSIDFELLKPCFMAPIDSLIFHIKSMLELSPLENIDLIMVVGGFGESFFVQKTFRESFPYKTIITPVDSGLVVLKGAVLYGHDTAILSSRIARYTYGVKATTRFKENEHPPEYKMLTDNGPRCINIFKKLVEVGQHLPLGHTISQTGRPLVDGSSYINISLYRSTEKDPKYVTDEGSEQIGHARIELDCTKSASENSIVEILYFGDTTIRFFIQHVLSRKEVEIYVDI